MLDLNRLGQRICIIGVSSSGKSTLAELLALKIGVKVYHLDQRAHQPHTHWLKRPLDEFITEHDEIISTEKWVIEGNYSVCMPQRFRRATAVIFMDPPLTGFLYRYLKRCLFSEVQRVGRLEGAKSEFSFGLIKFTFSSYPKNRLKYEGLLKDMSFPILHIRSMRVLNDYYHHWGLEN